MPILANQLSELSLSQQQEIERLFLLTLQTCIPASFRANCENLRNFGVYRVVRLSAISRFERNLLVRIFCNSYSPPFAQFRQQKNLRMNRQREKILNAIVYFAKHTKYCYHLKLMKLLYFFDFWHFRETGRSVTGLDYQAWEKGPVPPIVYSEIKPENNPKDLREYVFVERHKFDEKEGECLFIKPKKKFNDKIFTKRELEILERVVFVFKEAKAKDMTDSTHLPNSPWDTTVKQKGESGLIDYELALDDSESSLNFEDVFERNKLRSETIELLNAI